MTTYNGGFLFRSLLSMLDFWNISIDNCEKHGLLFNFSICCRCLLINFVTQFAKLPIIIEYISPYLPFTWPYSFWITKRVFNGKEIISVYTRFDWSLLLIMNFFSGKLIVYFEHRLAECHSIFNKPIFKLWTMVNFSMFFFLNLKLLLSFELD